MYGVWDSPDLDWSPDCSPDSWSSPGLTISDRFESSAIHLRWNPVVDGKLTVLARRVKEDKEIRAATGG